ncbi:glycosyltransferase family 2 protein [Bifidobacterium eulemuris]|uniref:Glycosyltransferase family 2 protein n=1 Tax=Bifidobacterium eulemuris TaxID=1765219 RepID=A0A7L9SRA9_9BIFI|nr:glycosyltransferase family 2 protein [Bifidobacterium eulemuris]
MKMLARKTIKFAWNALPGKKVFYRWILNRAVYCKKEEIPNCREIVEAASPRPRPTSLALDSFKYPASLDVSIIVPCYNVSEYVEDCLESLKQSDCSYEIIAVDDGSTDDTLLKLEACARRDSHIKIIHKENGGLASARNTGIPHACGRFILFVDSDDLIKNDDYLKHLLHTQKKTEAKIVTGVWEPVDEKANIKGGSRSLVQEGFAWGRLYDRSVWEHLRFPEGYLFEDSVIGYCCIPFFQRNQIEDTGAVYLYRTRDGSIMRSLGNNPKGVDTYWVIVEMLRLRDELGLAADMQLYRMLIRQFGTMAYERIYCLSDEQKRAFFCLCCDLLAEEPFKTMKLESPTLIEHYVELALKTHKYDLWEQTAKLPPLNFEL